MDTLPIQSLLEILLGEFNDKLSLVKDLMIRDTPYPDVPGKIKVIVGMRRAGKTYFLYQQILKLIKEGVSLNSILYINFEDDRLLPLDQSKLSKMVEAFYTLYPENHERKCYLFFDEIQNVENWPVVIRRLSDSKNVDICLTGSSAKLLSTEIATSLRGRSLKIEIWPYSFNEYLRAQNIKISKQRYDKKTQDTLKQHFLTYLTSGGFPELISFESSIRQQTLQEYVDVAIYRDIVERHHVKNPTLIKYMILSMLHNISLPFSLNKFYNDTKSQGYRIGKDNLYDYANYIEDAYLAFNVSIYDSSIRKIHANPRKIYAVDPGLVRSVTFDYESNLGKLFENVVYLDLRRQRCNINYYLTKERFEIDFLAQTVQGNQKLLQVVWQTDDKATLNREVRALDAAMDELKIEGEIITLDSYLRKRIV